MGKELIREITDLAHKHDIYVSTGDWAEHLLRQGPSSFKQYVEVCGSDMLLHFKICINNVHKHAWNHMEQNMTWGIPFQECKALGFDTIELNAGSLKLPEEALLRLVRLIKSSGLRAKPLFSVKFDSSDIPASGDRAFGAYIAPVKKQNSGKLLCYYQLPYWNTEWSLQGVTILSRTFFFSNCFALVTEQCNL